MKICTGEKHLQNSCHFVEVLLELAYADIDTQMHDSELKEVQVKWIYDDTLEITGTSFDKKKKPKTKKVTKKIEEQIESLND